MIHATQNSELAHTLRWIHHHPHVVTAIGIVGWVLNNVVTRFVAALPAPTKKSSPRYVHWFRLLNRVCGNLQRARSCAIETSPNWPDALQKYLDSIGVKNGQQSKQD